MEPENYYKEQLAAGKLVECYRIAPPRVRQYMAAEISYILEHIEPGDAVLDLGCGFGRVMPDLAQKAALVVGIDNSGASLALAKERIRPFPHCRLARANALHLCFKSGAFDVTVCIQNGISAFHVDQRELLKESLRVTRPGGRVLFSSYSAKFWDHRLEWFHKQADAGLLGEIDREKTRDGVIICKDGFRATTVDKERFLTLATGLNAAVSVTEVDDSSIFCRLIPV